MVALVHLGHDVLELAVIEHAHVHMLNGKHLRGRGGSQESLVCVSGGKQEGNEEKANPVAPLAVIVPGRIQSLNLSGLLGDSDSARGASASTYPDPSHCLPTVVANVDGDSDLLAMAVN